MTSSLGNTCSTTLAEIGPALQEQPGPWPTRVRRADMAKRTCSIPDCERGFYGRGLCNMHWQRLRKTGTTDALPPKVARPPWQRWRSVMRRVPSHLPEWACWPWAGYVDETGYGRFGEAWAHRVVYRATLGPIPRGLQVDHRCNNRPCVNPHHLKAVTPRENTIRSSHPHMVIARSGACAQGHEFSDENTYVRPDTGHRICRACKRERDRRYYAEGRR